MFFAWLNHFKFCDLKIRAKLRLTNAAVQVEKMLPEKKGGKK
jgi:hypothetical protein